MSNGATPAPSGNGGLGGVLMTLASSGDNWVKMLLAGGMILNIVLTKKTDSDVDKHRMEVIRQVGVIYRNQKTWRNYIKQTNEKLDELMKKQGLTPKPLYDYPQVQVLPEFEDEE